MPLLNSLYLSGNWFIGKGSHEGKSNDKMSHIDVSVYPPICTSSTQPSYTCALNYPLFFGKHNSKTPTQRPPLSDPKHQSIQKKPFCTKLTLSLFNTAWLFTIGFWECTAWKISDATHWFLLMILFVPSLHLLWDSGHHPECFPFSI